MPFVLGFPIFLPEQKLSFHFGFALLARKRFVLLLVRLILAFECLLRFGTDPCFEQGARCVALCPLRVCLGGLAGWVCERFGEDEAAESLVDKQKQLRVARFRAKCSFCGGIAISSARSHTPTQKGSSKKTVHIMRCIPHPPFAAPFFEKADNPGGQVTDGANRARTTNRAVFFLLRPQTDDTTRFCLKQFDCVITLRIISSDLL